MAKRRRTEAAPEWTLHPGLAAAILALAFLLPNLNALSCRFVLDDVPLIVDNTLVHSPDRLPRIWQSGYWPDRLGLTLYRPVTISIWNLLWWIGDGAPWVFHLFNLILGAVVPVLLFFCLRAAGVEGRKAFLAALFFAALPIHTEATTSVVGSSELLAACFGALAFLMFVREKNILAVILFSLAVLSKESAATIAGIALLTPRKTKGQWAALGGFGIVIAAALFLRHHVQLAPSFVPPIDNPAALLPASKRVLTALWVQCLYLWKTFVPVELSADYSYKQIPLVMGLGDSRAWIALVVPGVWILAAFRSRDVRQGLLVWAILFLPASNILFPIGTILGERLAYLPSLGAAILLAALATAALKKSARNRVEKPRSGGLSLERLAWIGVVVVVLVYGARSFVRNQDWNNAETFYVRLVETSPRSAKSHYFLGSLLVSKGDDLAAIREYEIAVSIFPAYSEAFHNRGNALARLGRYPEARESYLQCLRFDPGHQGAAANAAAIDAGVPIIPARRSL